MDLFVLLWTDSELELYRWHWKDFFGWNTLRTLVYFISRRTHDHLRIEAWTLVRTILDLAITALQLEGEKRHLVEDMIELARVSDDAIGVQSSPDPDYMQASGRRLHRYRPWLGTNAHNAMLPALPSLGTTFAGRDTSNEATVSSGRTDRLGKIDWAQLNRLLAQLCV